MDSALMKIAEVANRSTPAPHSSAEIIAEGRLRHHRLGRGQGAIRVSEENPAITSPPLRVCPR